MNVFTFSGNLGKDCRQGNAGGTDVCNFSVAVKSGYGDKQQTVWVDCAYWGKGGSAVAQYLTKGQGVAVTGELGTKEHEGKTYVTCRVDRLTLIGKKEDRHFEPEPQPGQGEGVKPNTAAADFEDDSIPF